MKRKNDYAFGAIVFKKDGENLSVLLAKKPQITSWDLPKGHKEGDESDIESALREVSEETGYKKVTLHKDKSISVSYEAEKNGLQLLKTVTFYLGDHVGDEVPEQHLDDDEDELGMEVEWIDVDRAVDLVTFPPFQEALKEAIKKYE